MITKHDKRRAWNEYYKKRTMGNGSPTSSSLAGFNDVKEMTYVPNTTVKSVIRNNNGFLIKDKLTKPRIKRLLSGDDSLTDTAATISSSAILKLAMVGVISALTTEVIRRAIWKK